MSHGWCSESRICAHFSWELKDVKALAELNRPNPAMKLRWLRRVRDHFCIRLEFGHRSC